MLVDFYSVIAMAFFFCHIFIFQSSFSHARYWTCTTI